MQPPPPLPHFYALEFSHRTKNISDNFYILYFISDNLGIFISSAKSVEDRIKLLNDHLRSLLFLFYHNISHFLHTPALFLS